jgi:hypothetical protein
MAFEIVNVGRNEASNIIEFSGRPTLEYMYQGEARTLVETFRATIPERATDIKVNGVPLAFIQQADRTLVTLGEQTNSHVLDTNSLVRWTSVAEYLTILRNPANPHVIGRRRSGKTTALCIRAIEFRFEGLSVNIIVPNTTMGVVVRSTLEDVARELYPETHHHYLAQITVSTFAREGFDRYLVDENRLVTASILKLVRTIHGSVSTPEL